MHPEFEAAAGRKVTPEDYAIIEHVYTFHPAISNMGGKQEIARLYKAGGMGLMRAMTAAADENQEREESIRHIDQTIEGLQEQIHQLRKAGNRLHMESAAIYCEWHEETAAPADTETATGTK